MSARHIFTEILSRLLQSNFIRYIREDCNLPESGLENRARVLIFRFADVGSLEILPDE